MPIRRRGAPSRSDYWPSLREALRAHGYPITPAGFARFGEKIGKSGAAVRSYLYGEVRVPFDVLLLMADRLNTTEDALRRDGPFAKIFAEDSITA